MALAFPLALLALIPWGLLAWRLGRQQGTAQRVPFLHLWPHEMARHAGKRRLPPLPVLLALLGLLLLILAAAGPTIGRAERARVSVLVDAGPPAHYKAGDQTRIASALGEIASAADSIKPVRVFRRDVSPTQDTGRWMPAADLAAAEIPVSREPVSRGRLMRAIAEEREHGRAVLVLTDQRLGYWEDDPDVLVQPLPEGDLNLGLLDARIDKASGDPEASVLVKVGSDNSDITEGRSVEFTVSAGARTQTTQRVLPPGFAPQWIELPLPATSEVVGEVSVSLPPDAWDEDNRITLRLRNRPLRLETRGDLPAPIVRMIDALIETRRPADVARVATITSQALEQGRIGIQVVDTGPAVEAGEVRLLRPVEFLTNVPLTMLETIPATAVDTEGRWLAVAERAGRVVIAVREGDEPQIRMGLDTTALADEAAFVRLWADMTEFVAGGRPGWTVNPGRAVESRDEVVVPARRSMAEAGGWLREQARQKPMRISISPGLILGALAALFGSVAADRRRD